MKVKHGSYTMAKEKKFLIFLEASPSNEFSWSLCKKYEVTRWRTWGERRNLNKPSNAGMISEQNKLVLENRD